MNKIYKLKQWYSLSDAAKRLTQTLSESVEELDVLELAIEGHIQLHWYMRYVPSVEVEFKKKQIQPLKIKNSKFLGKSGKDIKFFVDGYSKVNPSKKITYLDGAHMLLLDKCSALTDYLRSYLTGTGGQLISINGYYIEDFEGRTWNVLEHYEVSHAKELENADIHDYYDLQNYFPSSKWPEFSELGFTKTEIEKFEAGLNDPVIREINTRERTTLLKMIAGMANDGYGYDPSASRSPFPKELEGILDSLGMPVSDDTIRRWLKEASEYLPQNNDTD